MGATNWLYFVPYQADIKEALQNLRADVFLRNDYYAPFTKETLIKSLEEALRNPERYNADADLLAVWQQDLARLKSLSEADTDDVEEAIQEVLAVNSESGTHSILDIHSISPTVGFGVAAPLSSQELHELFGTDKPTHQMIESKSDEILSLRKRWEGAYIIVYQNGKANEVAFAGYSGD